MIDIVVYGSETVEEYGSDVLEDIHGKEPSTGTTWVRATNASDEELQRVAETFDIHPVAVSDVQNNVHPKMESFEDYTFVLVKEAELAPGDQPFSDEIYDEPVGVFFGTDWVVTLSPASIEAVVRVRDAIAREERHLLERGPDFTAYRIIDALVNEYFDLLDHIEGEIEAIEDVVIESTDTSILERINEVRRDLLAFRRIVWPTREATAALARGDSDHIQLSNEKYYRDVHDHLVQVADLAMTYRELVSGARDIYLNTVSQSTNEVMKRLTIIATVFLPLTFIAGVYGMNFDGAAFNLPELTWPYAYPAVMLGIALVSAIMVAYFHQQGYL